MMVYDSTASVTTMATNATYTGMAVRYSATSANTTASITVTTDTTGTTWYTPTEWIAPTFVNRGDYWVQDLGLNGVPVPDGDVSFKARERLTPDRRRARRLLRELVGDKAYRSWVRYKRLDVTTESGKRYRFKLWSTVMLMHGRRGGVALESWCIVPQEVAGQASLNPEDRMISQLLYVLASEEEARKVANVTVLKRVSMAA